MPTITRKLTALTALLTALVAVPASASQSPVTAEVTAVGTYGDGAIYVFFKDNVTTCSSKKRIDLSADNPARDAVYSAALSALMSGKLVKLRASHCATYSNKTSTTSGTITGNSSYLYMTNQPVTN